MYCNAFKCLEKKLKSDQPAIGYMITSGDSALAELPATIGFDFCWLDGEHGSLPLESILHTLQVLRGTGCAALVRVPSCDHTQIKKVIDFAPEGIIVPMVNSAEEAEYAVSACRYPPRGNRGCGFRAGIRHELYTEAEYWEQSRQEPLIFVQIEHIDAVKNLTQILATPDLDGICIGPYDLSASMGIPGNLEHPELDVVINEVCRKTHESGKYLGAFGSDWEHWLWRRPNFLCVTSDFSLLLNAATELLKKIRKHEIRSLS